jgi:NADP-dependent 3-hydroxy acid dehydrogenase YdfG
VLGARRVEACEEVAACIGAEGGEAVACHLALADPGSVTRFAKEAEAGFGPAEVLVSSAAKIQLGPALETCREDFEEILRVNVGGAQRLVRAFGAGMVECRRGDLIFVTSDVVAHLRPRASAYVTSKWGLEHGNGLGSRRHVGALAAGPALGPSQCGGGPARGVADDGRSTVTTPRDRPGITPPPPSSS